MTDFLASGTLPDHYEQLAKTVRDFAQSVVAPVAAKHDEEHSFPYEVVSGMADMGLFGLPFPEEYGGMGGDYFALCSGAGRTRQGRPERGDHPRSGRVVGRDARVPLRQRGAEAGMAAAAGQR